jgi:hypothetical protein
MPCPKPFGRKLLQKSPGTPFDGDDQVALATDVVLEKSRGVIENPTADRHGNLDTVRKNSKRLRRIMVCLQSTSTCAYRDMCGWM